MMWKRKYTLETCSGEISAANATYDPMLIPTIDTDLQVLSGNKEKFAAIGTKVMISPDPVWTADDVPGG